MNKEKLKGYVEKIKTALGKVSKKIWILIAAVLVVLVVGVVIFFKTRPYATLITGATSEEFGTVLNWLSSQGVTNYRVEGGDTILVPESQAPSLKARLLQEQYSQSDSTFSGYFERVSALSTQSERDTAMLTALKEEIEKTIRQFPGVQNVSVGIDLGEDQRFVLSENDVVEASASVLLFMQSGKTLTDEQANAIRNYIKGYVAALDFESILIEDSNGNDYNDLSIKGTSAADTSALKLYMEKQWGDNIRKEIIQYLATIYGEENVSVAVKVAVELGDKTVNDYVVHLPELDDDGDGSNEGKGIIGEKTYSWQVVTDGDVAAGGLVGTPSNSELPNYVEEGGTVEEILGRLAADGVIKYDNSKTQTQIVTTAATLTDVTVSVGINRTTAGPVSIEDIRSAAASAAGIVAPLELPDGVTVDDYLARYISVLNDAFYVPPAPEPELTFLQRMGIPGWVVIAAVSGLLLFIAILVTILMLVRRNKRKKEAEEQKAVEELLAITRSPLAGEVGPDGELVQPVLDENGNPVAGADVMDLHTERSMELRQSIRDFVDENMEVAALLLKSWMKEDGDHG